MATVSLAASVAAVIVWQGRMAPEMPGASASAAIVAPAAVVAPSERLAPILEVELYTWANRNQRRPETAASAIFFSGSRSRKRPAAVEVLALDLANAAPGLAEGLEPLAVLHKSPRRGPRPHGTTRATAASGRTADLRAGAGSRRQSHPSRRYP